jgi:hypothetical protein
LRVLLANGIHVPILARNKVLDRIQPAAVDVATKWLNELADKQIEGLDVPDNEQGEITLEHYLDLAFPSRIAGQSFKVLPIAIYI